MNENGEKRITVVDGILLVLGLILGIGTKVVFHACAETADSGMYMSCHWAEQMAAALGFVVAVQAVFLFLFGAKVRMGISLAMIPTALLAVITPGILINLCMMKDMRCHSVMRPAVVILGVLIMAAACVNVIMEWRRKR